MMKIKRSLAIIIALLVIISTSGCISQNKRPEGTTQTEHEEIWYKQYFARTSDESVIYTLLWNRINGGSMITAVYNADGSFKVNDTNQELSTFVIISDSNIESTNYRQYTMYDPETLVMYIAFWDYVGNGTTITALFNSDGSVKTYNNEKYESTFVLLQENYIGDGTYKQYTIYDPNTLVMYAIFLDDTNNESAISAIYNADGSLKTYNSNQSNTFSCVSSTNVGKSRYDQCIIYDVDTLVQYSLIVDNISQSLAVIALYNADGSLKLYQGNQTVSNFVLLSSSKIEDSRYKQYNVYDSEELVIYTLLLDYANGDSIITALFNKNGKLKTYNKEQTANELVFLLSGYVQDGR